MMPEASAGTGEEIHLSAEGSEAAIALLGGQPVAWRVEGRELLWSGDPAHWEWHAPLLFPVVGQVNGGRVRISGLSYDVPRHGFARTSRFRCVEQGQDRAVLRLDPESAETSFPLAFRLDLTVILRRRSLALEFMVGNPG